MTTPRDPYKAGRGYDARDDYPGAKATRRRRGSNQWARRQGRELIVCELRERYGQKLDPWDWRY